MRISQELSDSLFSDFSLVLNNGKPLIRGELGALLTSPVVQNSDNNNDRLLLLSSLSSISSTKQPSLTIQIQSKSLADRLCETS